MAALTRQYYDTALSANGLALSALRSFRAADAGPFYGSDSPFAPSGMMNEPSMDSPRTTCLRRLATDRAATPPRSSCACRTREGCAARIAAPAHSTFAPEA